MWSILYFPQLAGQYRLFGIPFYVQTNCSHFVEIFFDLYGLPS